VRMLRGWGVFRQKRAATALSLAPLIVLALVAAIFMTESSVTLAYPFFQSPVQTPRPTTPPVQPATQVPQQPPQESPMVPPAESPVVPPAESPVAPTPESPFVPPVEEPGQEGTPSVEPEATPREGTPAAVATPTAAEEEEGSAPGRGVSWAVLIDTLVVGLSGLWLCCGGLALVIFVLLIIASFVLRVT
jgi:cytoskeletal protein RodZ